MLRTDPRVRRLGRSSRLTRSVGCDSCGVLIRREPLHFGAPSRPAGRQSSVPVALNPSPWLLSSPVSVAVLVPVPVVDVAVRFRGSVQDDSDNRSLHPVQHLDRPGDVPSGRRLGRGDDDDGVHMASQHGRIRDWENGRTVDDHHVRCLGKKSEDIASLRASEQFRRIGRHRTRRQDGQVSELRHVDERVLKRRVTDKHRREPEVVCQPEELMDPRSAEVAADQHDVLARLGHGDGKVCRGRRLAVSGSGARDLHCLDRAIKADELDRRPETPVGLGWRRLCMLGSDQEWLLLVSPFARPWDEAKGRQARRPPARAQPWFGCGRPGVLGAARDRCREPVRPPRL